MSSLRGAGGERERGRERERERERERGCEDAGDDFPLVRREHHLLRLQSLG